MTDIVTPGPSKRAKSQAARDLVYGRGGGRNLPLQSDYEQHVAFMADVDRGLIVRVVCFCTWWWLVRKDVGTRCRHCDEPMVAEPRAIELLDERDAS